MLPGLEGVLASEISAKLPEARADGTARGKVFVSAPPLPDFASVRTADNVYRLIGRFRVGSQRADLPALAAAVRGLRFPPTAALRPTFFVNASRAGRHTYSRFEAAAAAAEGIAQRFPRWGQGAPEAHDLEFRLDITDGEAVLSLRLTPPSFRYRGAERAFSRAALRPTAAHGLVWLSGPSAEDRFLDPFCGSGTILCERLAYPAAALRGGDLSPAALAAAARNLGDAPVVLSRWDARDLPLDAGSVDRVVTNLPFGRQVGALAEVPELYAAFARELRRVLRPAGTAILLSDQGDTLRASLERAGLRCRDLLLLSLKGRHPRVFQAGG